METGVHKYVKMLGEFGPISAEQEYRLIAAWKKKGDRAALNRLMAYNLKLVVKDIRRTFGNTDFLEDLIAAGGLGLMRSLDKFSLDQGVRFYTYAKYRAHNEIRKAMFELRSAITTHRGDVQYVRMIQVKVSRADDLESALKELKADTGISERKLWQVYIANRTPHRTDDEELAKKLRGGEGPDPEKEVGAKQFASLARDRIEEALQKLSDIEQDTVRSCIMNGDTLKAVADRRGVSRQWIEQVKKRAEAKLSIYLADMKDDLGDGQSIF